MECDEKYGRRKTYYRLLLFRNPFQDGKKRKTTLYIEVQEIQKLKNSEKIEGLEAINNKL